MSQRRNLREEVDALISDPGDECIPFPGAVHEPGYGKVTVGGQRVGAHQYVCRQTHGPAPSAAHEVAHAVGCVSRACINPRHLRWATRVENLADRVADGTVNDGERNGSAKLTADQVLEIRRRVQAGERQRALTSEYKVDQSSISHIVRGNNWRTSNVK